MMLFHRCLGTHQIQNHHCSPSNRRDRSEVLSYISFLAEASALDLLTVVDVAEIRSHNLRREIAR